MTDTRFGRLEIALLLTGFVTACGGGSNADDVADSDAGDEVFVGECAEPVALSGLDDVVPLLGNADDWARMGPYGWEGSLPITTPDLQATTDLLLDATSLAVPGWCDTGCRAEVRFLVVGAVDGVAVEGVVDDDYRLLGDRPLLRVAAGAVFRLRPVVRDQHPSTYTWVPILEVLPPCTTACEADFRRCPADLVCYRAGDFFCLYCEARPASVCACVGVPSGSECFYALSNDNVATGHCSDGDCVRD